MKLSSPTALRVRVGLVIVAALAVASCGSSAAVGSPAAAIVSAAPATVASANTVSTATTGTVSSTGSNAIPDTAGKPAVVPAILQVSSPLVGGSELNAASFAGKPVAFWFWAPT